LAEPPGSSSFLDALVFLPEVYGRDCRFINDLLHRLLAQTASLLASPLLDDTDYIVDTFPYMIDEAAEELAGHLWNEEASPALCSALGIAQPTWTKPNRWVPSADVPNTEQGEAILMALGITTPATILTAIYRQCRSGSPFDRHAPPETAPQQMRELHEALTALKPHAT
jgi:hypothetical protein